MGQPSKIKRGERVTISLSGEGELIRFGLNWGAIPKRWLLGWLTGDKEPVDLDSFVSVFDKNKKHLYTVGPRDLISKDGLIRHSGDDSSGDLSHKDEFDNEFIDLEIGKLPAEIHYVAFYFHSVSQRDFSQIPYTAVTIYSIGGGQKHPLYKANFSSNPLFAEFKVMVIGILRRNSLGSWDFTALGEGVPTKEMIDTADYISRRLI